jgi:para-nitrobenzyl esterase
VKTGILRAAMAALALVCAGSAAAAPVKAKLDTGVVVGQADNGVAVFRGIPFAAPPLGALRWKPPQPAKAWSGERAANANGAACLQTPIRFGNTNLAGDGAISEDCLYLNVFAPAGARKAPVMVWIHGGANVAGTASVYDGSGFARDGVVLVAFNYRLGALGFFAHPALTKEAPAGQPLGDYALMDQIAALEWVKRNAAAFGGDPNNVTVFGESAGAMNIVALLGTPSAKGLFHKAIMESNVGWGTATPLAAAEQVGEGIAEKAGAGAHATVGQLRSLTPQALLAAGGQFRTIVDGRMITESANQAIAGGRAIDVPIIIGSNSYEAILIANRTPKPTPLEMQGFTDGFAGAPARWIAGHEATGAPSWLYYFSYVREADRANSPGAAHASEIPYVFDAPFRSTTPDTLSPADKAMATLMHSCWVAFARTGKPDCASGPAWPAYTADGDQLMEFGVDSGVRQHFRKGALDFLEARFSDGKGPL